MIDVSTKNVSPPCGHGIGTVKSHARLTRLTGCPSMSTRFSRMPLLSDASKETPCVPRFQPSLHSDPLTGPMPGAESSSSTTVAEKRFAVACAYPYVGSPVEFRGHEPYAQYASTYTKGLLGTGMSLFADVMSKHSPPAAQPFRSCVPVDSAACQCSSLR